MIVAGLRVDQDDPIALVAQRLAGLGAGVVELAGLADDDRAGADDEDGLDVSALGHDYLSLALARVDQLDEPLEEVVASFGPGEASGWYCTEKTGLSVQRRPSTVPSNSETCVTSTLFGQRFGIDAEAVVLRR